MLYAECLSFKGRLWSVMCVIIPKATMKITKQRVVANKPTKEIRWYHKSKKRKEEQRLDDVFVRVLQRNKINKAVCVCVYEEGEIY